MEHDTSKTFREIHGTLPTFVAELERIQRLALPSFKTSRNSAHPIELRFLTPLIPQPKGQGANTVHLRLTHPGEHRGGQEYVAVSYTWHQDDSLIAAFGDSIPEYTIWGSDCSEPRTPRCNPLVLHRAYEFARARCKTVLLWIDQECIVQDSLGDVEMHLLAMHEIYRRSAYTVVLLSSMIDSVYDAAGLFPFVLGRSEVFDETLLNDDCRGRKQCLTSLTRLARDRWFTRTWTYQERFFASVCYYLVALSPALTVGTHTEGVAGLGDWCIPADHLVAFAQKIDTYQMQGKGHLRMNLDPRPSDQCSSCLYCMAMMLDVRRLIKLDFEASRSNNHKIHLPGFEKFGIMSMGGIATAHELMNEEYGPAEQEEDSMRGRFETANAVLSAMEACGNAVVADRVSIFANVCQFRWTLQTVVFRKEKASYSTCILVLLLLNVVKRHDSDTKRWVAETLMDMDMTIGDYIRSQLFPFSRSMYKSTAAYPDYF